MHKNKYRPIRRVGVGGMGEVLLASQQGAGGSEKLVVLKRISPHLRDDAEFAQAFVDEARLAATLRHPNLVEVFDVHRDNEMFFVAMEYVSGEDLRYLMGKARKGELTVPVPVACRILADVADGLEYVHHARDADGKPLGMAHREIAPGNIIVSYAGLSKVIDFGVGKVNISQIYTKPGALKGKFAYMSPEQVQHKPLDQRSHVFSLGVVGWELLTGRRLFKGSAEAAVLRAVMEHDPEPPSLHNSAVPAQVDRIILRALSRDRDARPASAAEVRDQLGAALQERAAQHRDVGQWMRSSLGRKHEERLALERAATSEARMAAPAPQAPAGGTLGPLASSAAVAGVPSTGTHSRALAPGATGGASVTPSLGPSPAGRRAAPAWIFALLGAIIVLAVIAMIGIGFWVGRGDNSEPVATPIVEPAPDVAEAPRSVKLTVHVQPSGASLYVDGTKRPGTVGESGEVIETRPEREVHLRAVREGYQPYETTVRAPASGAGQVHLNLDAEQPAVAATPRESTKEPPLADPAPVRKRAPVAVSKRASSRRATRARRTIRQSRPTPRSVRQAPVLVVSYAPAEATLIVDGKQRSGRSPVRIENLDEGTHTVTVKAAGYATSNRSVTLEDGRQRVLNISLQESFGTVDLVSVPSGAEVTVDGRPKGRAPIMGLRLSTGKVHRIEARLPGFKRWSTQVTPDAGKNPTVVAAMVAEGAHVASGAASPTARRVADIRVSRATIGQASRGRTLVSGRCGSCHGKRASRVSPRRYTRAQWNRYFSTTRHAVHSPFRKKFSRTDLADVKAYMMSRAADVQSATAAGVR